MNSSGSFSYFFRKFPLVRVALTILVIGVIIFSIFLFNYRTKQVPEIDKIVPSVGSPGDVVVVYGKNFGNTRDMSYVEIAGTKLTASSYISWSDDVIKLVLPANVEDGLVFVGTRDLRSKPALFANEVDIPVPVPAVVLSTKPVIAALSSEKFDIGQELTISGNNFGEAKNDSRVLFTIDYNNKISEAELPNKVLLTENMESARDFDLDYVSWSNTEIKVRVPDGACSGVVVVDTGKEKSEPKNITVNETVGKKTFTNKKIYLMQYAADIADVVTTDVATITLRCPIPVEMASQPQVEITETNPSPVLLNYQNDIIYQLTRSKSVPGKNVFEQTFVLPVYEVRTKVNVEKVTAYKNADKAFLTKYTQADELIPSEDDAVFELAKKITGKEKNNYKKAKLVYDYMCTNFKIGTLNKKATANPLDLIEAKRGDAYDFAVIYTALLRSLDIPCVTDAGVLVQQDLQTVQHWWSEFYIEGIGWIPVDVSIGAGLEYKKWYDVEIGDEKEYYFGNLDSHHITFSRGWNSLKPFSQENKIVQQPRSFALQTIWEESSSDTLKYSSYWGLPVIKGIY